MSGAALAAGAAAVCAALAAAQLDAAGIAGGRTRPQEAVGVGTHGAPTVKAGTAPGAASVMARRMHVLRETPLAMRAVLAVVAGTVGLQLGGAVAGLMIGAAAVGASLARARLAAGRAARQRERAAPALARAMADALRGGASVRGALTAASTDRAVPPPLREEVSRNARAIAVGSSLPEALDRLAQRGGPTLRLLCGTSAMYLEAGGALASALDRLAEDGEAAARIDEDRVAATAQARATVRVVAALPVLALLGAQAASHDFLQTIAANPAALALLLLGFALEAAAIVASRAIVGASR